MKAHNYLKVIAAAALFFNLGVSAVTPNISRGREAEAARWADSVYASLTDRQRVAQLLVPMVITQAGYEKAAAAVKRYVGTDGVGGLLFSEGSIEQYVRLCDLAQSEAKVPLLMTADGEWGVAMRVKDTPRFPKNIVIGAVTDKRLVYDYGREVARQCKILGINTDFAPDADVNSNPANPVIGSRSFGENPQRVAEAAVAFSLGMEDGGVQAVAKHFPGHGDTDGDSHKGPVTINHSRKVLDDIDLVPFSKFIEAGCSGIMTGHLVVPALDPSQSPASLSSAVSAGFLRKVMGFEGLVFTDALEMKGAVAPDGKNNCVAALLAGADVLLVPKDVAVSVRELSRALADGTIPRATLEDRCKRLLRYKYYLGLNRRKPLGTDYAAIARDLNSPEALALLRRLAAGAITVVKNEGGILPMGRLAERTFSVVSLGAPRDNEFAATCERYANATAFQNGGEAFSTSSLAKIEKGDVVIAAVFSDNAAARQALAQLTAGPKPVVGVFMISPFRISKFGTSLNKLSAMMLGYEDIPDIRRCAAEAVFGGIAVSGRLPVNIGSYYRAGAGINLPKTRLGFTSPVVEGFDANLTDSLDTLVKKGLETRAFPGCQLLVARNGNIVYEKSFGKITGTPGAAPVNALTVYDLASVSKATGTLPGIMKAYDSGLVSLDDSLGCLIPEITDSAKQHITVRELLYHETGMPAALNMYNVMFDSTSYTGRLITGRRDRTHTIRIQNKAWGHNRARMRTDIIKRVRSDEFPVEASKGIFTGSSAYDTIMNRIYTIPLRANKDYNYSCLNFALLMDIEQRRTGIPHQNYVQTEIFGPLGAWRTGYRPLERFGSSEIAPTEYDSYMRRQKVHGYVHDEMANFSGGVQGNAGLFANACDIAKICQMWLNGGIYGDARVLSPETVKLFTTAKSPTCRRGLGFDKPDTEHPDWSPTCDEASPEVYGHLGFTGTVFWVDPRENLIFIFLTNRVDPTRDNAAFNRLSIRPRLFSQVYKAILR